MARYGSTTSASPSASITTIMSTVLPPKPPCSASNGTPRMPISAMAAHTSSLKPADEEMILARASKP